MHTRLNQRMGNFEAPIILLIALLVLVAVNAFGQASEGAKPAPPPEPIPPPVVAAPPASQISTQAYVYDQKPLPGRSALVQPEQAKSIIDRFKAAYPKLGSPRMLIYVNRNLVDEESGIRMIARTEKTDVTRTKSKSAYKVDPNYKGPASSPGNVTNSADLGARDRAPGEGSTSSSETSTSENRYSNTDRKEPALADRQTVRDVERLFGRPLRMAGAKLADQRLATQLMD